MPGQAHGVKGEVLNCRKHPLLATVQRLIQVEKRKIRRCYHKCLLYFQISLFLIVSSDPEAEGRHSEQERTGHRRLPQLSVCFRALGIWGLPRGTKNRKFQKQSLGSIVLVRIFVLYPDR